MSSRHTSLAHGADANLADRGQVYVLEVQARYVRILTSGCRKYPSRTHEASTRIHEDLVAHSGATGYAVWLTGKGRDASGSVAV